MSHPEINASLYEAIFLQAADSIEVLDEHGYILACNPAYQNLLGYAANDMLGKHTTHFFHPDYRDAFEATLALMHQTGRAEGEVQLQPADGRRCVVWRQAQLRRDAHGAPIGIVVYSRDISDRKQAEQQQKLQAQALNATVNAVVITDVSGKIQWVNPAFTKITGYTLEEAVGNTPRVLKSGRHDAVFYNHMWQTILAGQVWEGEIINRRKDGSDYYEYMTITPVHDPAGQVTNFVVIKQDISARKQIEADNARRVRDLARVADISAAIIANQEVQAVAETATRLTQRAFGLYHCHLFLLDDATQELGIAACGWEAGDPNEGTHGTTRIPLSREQSLVALAARTQQAVIVNDTQNDPNFMPNALLPRTRAEMAVPMLVGGRLVGVFDVQADTVNAFDEIDRFIYTTLAAQVAASIQEARFFAEVGKRALELETVARVSTTIATTLDPAKLLQEVVDLTKQAFNLYHAHIYLLNAAGDTLELAAGAGEVGRHMVAEGRRIALGSERSLVARAARTRQGVIRNDARNDPDFLPHPWLPETRSEMAVPMIVGDTVLGVLDVQADTVNRFTENDVRVKTTLAAQVAVALQNAKSFAENEKVKQAVNIVYEASASLNLVASYTELFDALVANSAYARADQRAELLILDQTDSASRVAYWSVSNEVLQPRQPLNEQPAIQLAVQNRQARLISVAPHTLLAAPLLVGTQAVGVMLGWYSQPNPVLEGELPLLNSLMNQAAVVAQNLRNIESARKRALELQIVSEIATFVASETDSDKMLWTVANLTRDRFNLYHAHIYLLNAAGDTLELAAGAGEVGRHMVAEGRRIALNSERSLVAQAARTRQGVIRNDARSDPNFLPNPLLPETRSEMSVPMIAGDTLLGVLDVQADVVDRFSEDDVQVKATLAAQVAVALQNAQHYQTTRRLGAIQRAIVQNAGYALIVVDTLGSVTLFNPAAETLLGYTAAEVVGLHTPALWHDPEETRQRAAIFSTELGQPVEPGFETFVIKSRLGLPNDHEWTFIRKDGRRVPVLLSLTAMHDEANTVTGYVAIAADITERKRIEADNTRRARDLAVVSEIGSAITASQDEHTLIEEVVRLTQRRFGLYHCHIFLMDNATQELFVVACGWEEGDEHTGTHSSTRIPLTRENSLVARAARTQQAVISNDTLSDPHFMPNALLPRTRAEMAVPMLLAGQVLGVFDVQADEAHCFGETDVFVYQTLAAQVAASLQEARFFAETRKQATELATVAQVSTAIATTLDPAQLLQEVADLTKSAFNLYHAHIYLLDDSGQKLSLAAGAGDVGRTMVAQGRTIDLNSQRSLVAQAARTRQGVIRNDARSDPNFLPNPLLPETRSEMAVPIIVGDTLLGVFDVQADIINRFTEDDVRIKTTLAAQIAVALQNAKRYQETQAALAQAEAARHELQAFNRRLVREGWDDYLHNQAANENIAFVIGENGHPAEQPALAHSLAVQGEPIGALFLAEPGIDPDLAQELLTEVAARLSTHLENLRLNERTELALSESRRLTAELRRLAEVQAALSQATTEADILAALMAVVPNPAAALSTLNYVAQHASGSTPTTHLVAGWTQGQLWPTNHPMLGMAHETALFDLLADYPGQVVISGEVHADPLLADWRAATRNDQAQAAVIVPLQASGQWQGVWVCLWHEPQTFTSEDRSVIQRLVGPTAAVVASRRAALAQQAALQDLANRDHLLAESAATANDLLRLGVAGFAEAFGRMGQALNISRLYIAENYEDGDGLLHTRLTNEWCASGIEPRLNHPAWQNLAYDINLPRWYETLGAGQTLHGLVKDCPLNERDLLEPLHVRALALLPLFVEGRFFGFLGADDCQTERIWNEFELEILQSLSITLANTIANGLLLEETQKRAEEMASVAELGNLAASILEVERMVTTVTQRAHASLHYYRLETYLLNDVGTVLVMVAGAGEAAVAADLKASLPLTETGFVVTRAARQKSTALVNNLLADFDLHPVPHLLEARAQVAVPLLWSDTVIGVLTAYAAHVDAFTPGDVNILATLASQITVAIENARSLQRAETTLRDLDRLTRQLTREGWQEFTHSTPESLAFAYDLLTVRALAAPTLENGLTQPLAVRGQTIGEIVLDYTPHSPEDDSTELLSAVAEQLSAHLENLRLTQQTQQALANTQQLYDLTARISAAASLEDIIHTASLINQAAGGVLFEKLPAEDGSEELLIKATWSAQPMPETAQAMLKVGARVPVAQFPAAEQWANAHQCVLYGDVMSDPRVDDSSRRINRAMGVRAAAFLPLWLGDQHVGILSLVWPAAQNFTENDQQRYELLAKQAAVVANNRLLLQQTERRAEELAVLNDISRTIAGLLDREQILLTLQEQLARVMPVESFFVGLYDPEKNLLRFPVHFEAGQHHPADEGPVTAYPLSASVLQTRQPRRVLRSAAEVQRLREERAARGDTSQPSGSLLFAPLLVGKRIIGVLSVQAYDLNVYTQDHLNLLTGVANQVAIALENANLFDQTQRRAAQLATVARVSTAASTVLDAHQLLQDVVDLTKTQFNLYHAHVYLLDASGVVLQLTAGAGEVGRQMVAMGRQIPLEAERSIVARAAYHREPVLVNNTRLSREFLPHPLLPNTRAELAVPLIVGDVLLGVLDVQADTENAFDEDDVRIQSTLAAQVAVALRNAQSYAEQLATVARLKELDELKSSFLANMSHELRTPLNSILGFTDVILEGLDGPLTDRMENDLRIVQKNGRHLLELINDVLDMAKIEAGRMTLGIEQFELPEVLEDVMDTALGLAHEKALELRLELDPGVSYHIEADRVRTRQVLYNLVSNAIKYTERGHVTLRAQRSEDIIHLTVEDTGLGIPQEKLKIIFEAFSQVDNSTTRKVGGTGLGLPITRHLVELHGGRLWVESEMGVGSKFHVELPVSSRYRPPED